MHGGLLLPAAAASSKITPACCSWHGANMVEACGGTLKTRAEGKAFTIDAGTCTTPLHAYHSSHPYIDQWPSSTAGIYTALA